jgi:hypothetical protein
MPDRTFDGLLDAIDAAVAQDTADPADGLSEDEKARIVAASLVDQTRGRNWHRTLREVERILVARQRPTAPPEDRVSGSGRPSNDRDGACICDYNPATTDGPQEDCPFHGRLYAYWVKRGDALTARLAAVEAILDVYIPISQRQRGCDDGCGCTDCEMAEDIRAAIAATREDNGGAGDA